MFDVIRRELRLLLRDPNRCLIAFLVPLFYICFYGTVFFTPNVEHIDVGILNQDGGALSQRLINMISSDPVLRVTACTDFDSMDKALQQRHLQTGIIIPSGWEATLDRGDQSRLVVYIPTTNFLIANEAAKHLQTVLETFNAGVVVKSLEASGMTPSAAISAVQPVTTVISSAGNPSYGYGQFVVFGILMIVLHQLLLIGMSQAVANEKEMNLLGECQTVARRRVIPFVIGKSAPYFLFFMIYFFFEIVIPFPLFHLLNLSNPFLPILYALPMFLTLTAIGMFVGTFFQSRAQVMQVLGVSSVPLLLMSGFFWPQYMLPWYLRGASLILPTYQLLSGVQAITQLGSTLHEQMKLFLLGWAQAAVWWGLVVWRWHRLFQRVEVVNALNPPSEPLPEPLPESN